VSAHSEYKGAYALLHDDEEEDLVGSDWHQRAITSLYNSLNDLATNTGQPWHVGNQLPLAAWKPNGDPWNPRACYALFCHNRDGSLRWKASKRREELLSLFTAI